MNDDLGQQLRALHERVPDGDPNLALVLRGGKKRRVQHRIAASSLIVVTALSGFFTIPRILDDSRTSGPDENGEAATHDDGIFIPAQQGEPTYVLEAITILYPWAPVDSSGISEARRDAYCSIRSEWVCGHRREQAGVSYQWQWATNDYPGTVQCRVMLASKDGAVVGQQDWELSGLETKSRRPHVIGVRVADRPVTARAECEAGAYPPGPGVRVEFVRAEPYTPTYVTGESPLPDRIRLIFQAEALADDHVDSRMCFGTLWFESGRKDTAEFTTNQGEGTWEFETGYPASDPVVDAKIRCRAIRASDG